jgi:type II secretory pathway pseudopilin PulG
MSAQQNQVNVSQAQSQQHANQQQQQQQGTIFTIPGTNNTIQIPANFAGKSVCISQHWCMAITLPLLCT